MDSPLLTILVSIPAAGAAGVLLAPRRFSPQWVAFGFAATAVVWSLILILPFDAHRGSPQFVQDAVWIEPLKAHYKVGVDGLSLPLVILTTAVSLLVVVAGWDERRMPRGYLALLLVLESSLLGTFVSLDLFLFYGFFEFSLLPIYFLIGLWGGPRRHEAAIKFFLYTLAGSVALLVGIVAVFVYSRAAVPGGTFDLTKLSEPAVRSAIAAAMGPRLALGAFAAMAVGFLVKLPAVPLHTWLPDAHVEAPTPVSMILAAVLLKLGGYGLLRVAFPLFPAAAAESAGVLAVVGGVSLVYGGLCALAQTDFKRMVAYSSISHMGLVTLGAATMSAAGWSGASFTMLAHGITSAGLFFIVGVVYQRTGRRDLSSLGGLAGPMPVYSGLSSVMIFANLGLPGLCLFVGEILTILAAFAAGRSGHPGLFRAAGVAAAVNLVVTAGYMLWALQRVFYGQPHSSDRPADLSPRELSVLTPLVVLAVLLGVLPGAIVFSLSDATIAGLVQ